MALLLEARNTPLAKQTIPKLLVEHLVLSSNPFEKLRCLLFTTEALQYIQMKREQFRMALLEMALILVSFLVIACAILLLRSVPGV